MVCKFPDTEGLDKPDMSIVKISFKHSKSASAWHWRAFAIRQDNPCGKTSQYSTDLTIVCLWQTISRAEHEWREEGCVQGSWIWIRNGPERLLDPIPSFFHVRKLRPRQVKWLDRVTQVMILRSRLFPLYHAILSFTCMFMHTHAVMHVQRDLSLSQNFKESIQHPFINCCRVLWTWGNLKTSLPSGSLYSDGKNQTYSQIC